MQSWVAKPKNESLNNIVECYWYAKDNPTDVMILPSAISNDILLNLNPPTTIFIDKNEKFSLNGNYFSGIRTKFFHVDQHGQFELYGLRFKPWVFALFFNLPPSSQVNLFLRIDESNKPLSKFNGLRDGLQATLTQEESVKEFDEFLGSHFLFESEVQKIFDTMFPLAVIDANLSVRKLASESGISISSIERYIKKYIGITPKVLFRILRYNEIWNALNDPKYTSWSDIVYEHGYFDQAHFIKEFKKFTGKSPSAYVMERNSTLDRYRLY